MAHEKTWQFAVNKPFGDVSAARNQAAWFLWQVLQVVLGRVAMTNESGGAVGSPGGLWTLAQCCDSTQVKTDGTDLFGSVFSVTPWVFNVSASVHSWFTIYNAAQGVWVTIDCRGSSIGAVDKIAATIHYAAPSGGTTSAAPTSVKDAAVSTPGAMMDISTTGAARKAHVALATDGSFTALHSKDAGGLVVGALVLTKVTDLWTPDPYPWWVNWEYSATGAWRGSAPMGTGGYVDQGGVARTISSGPTIPEANNAIVLNTTSAALTVAGKIPRFPTYLMNTTTKVLKGRVQDIKACPQGGDDTATMPNTGQVTDWRVGCFSVPMNTAPLL